VIYVSYICTVLCAYTHDFAFSEGQIQVLERLFELRFRFHQLATLGAPSHNMAAVCWVDNILAKLGEAVQCIIGNDKADALTGDQCRGLATLKRHQEDYALRAATQLPCTYRDSNSRAQILLIAHSDTLSQVVNIIGSAHASVAAIRLAICIMFSATTFHCTNRVKKHQSLDGYVEYVYLELFFNQSLSAPLALRSFLSNRGTKLSISNHPVQALQDRTVIAMAISMLAVGNFWLHAILG
jgi:hypothetical protein